MKAMCKRQSLAEALGVITAAVPTQAPTPIAHDVLLQADEKGLKLQSTDLTIFSEVNVLELKETLSGEALVPAGRLASLVHELDSEFVTLERPEGEYAIRVSSGNDDFKIMGHDPGDFPSAPAVTDCPGFEIETEKLSEALRMVSFAASRDPSRQQLMGVAFIADGGKVHFVASDGKRLAEYALAVSEHADRRREGIVPIAAIDAIGKLLPLDTDKARVRIDPELQQVVVAHERGRVMCRLLEGQMPDYVSLIPSEFVTVIEISARDLLAAVRKAAVLTTRENAIVSLQFEGGALSIRVSSQDVGSGVVPVEHATASGENLEVSFTVQFLSDGLRALGDVPIRLGLQKGKGAAVMHVARSFRYAFMPVKFKGSGEEE